MASDTPEACTGDRFRPDWSLRDPTCQILIGVGIFGLALLSVSSPLLAQAVSVDLGEGNTLSGRVVQLFLIVTLLSLAPGIAMMVTCFPFMVTVLSILRQAIGVQQAPPNMMIVSLALFLTWFVMEPVFLEAWEAGLAPLIAEEIEPGPAFRATIAPFQAFMETRVDQETLSAMQDAAPRSQDTDEARPALGVLVPAFLLSEIQRGFEVGFLVFLPFLIIDLVTASILMSMGMMMVPPVVVSLPFKLAFFVLADGWALLAGALVRSYVP